MKSKMLFVAAFIAVLLFSGCGERIKPDDITQFSTSSIVGVWVAIDEDNNGDILYYYDIKSNSHLLYVEQDAGDARYDKADGYMHCSADCQWYTAGDMTYTFDEKKQVIRCHTGDLWFFDVESIIQTLGSDEIFDVKRKGLDEAMIYDKTGWLLDAHVFRIKGVKNDLATE